LEPPGHLGIQKLHHRGFTLIELLVVVGIIGLLLAILMPSLKRARQSAKRSTCLARIKNIATSSHVYASEDPNDWGIPVHPLQYAQDPGNPTFIGAYEWGGKSGIGRADYLGSGTDVRNSRYGTRAGFGPATRPLNDVLYRGGFADHLASDNDAGMLEDAQLDLDDFKCPADDGPPRAAHCREWVLHPEATSSYDWFGNSYAANVFMIAGTEPESPMYSNSPYMRPMSRVPTPARTLFYEENIGRWAWACRREIGACSEPVGQGVDPGPTKAVRGWHGQDWHFNRSFVDAHGEYQQVLLPESKDQHGYYEHYRSERLASYPPVIAGADPDDRYYHWKCVIVRGDGWQKDTLPSPPIPTGLVHDGTGRPSYEGCVGD
jgi:prepilin-type N-terminal cleavage/methylation domain-containing protein